MINVDELDSFSSPYLFGDVNNSTDFNKLCEYVLSKNYMQLKTIYKQINKNIYIKKYFCDVYTNKIFDIKSQRDLTITRDNMDKIRLQFSLLSMFRKFNKLNYISKIFENSDENNNAILIYFIIQNKLKYNELIEKYVLKYKIYDLLYKLISINRLNNLNYYYDFNKDIIELIIKYKNDLKNSEIKKLLKRVNINNDSYNDLLSEVMYSFTPKQYIEIKKIFNDNDIIEYISIIKKYKNNKFIIDGIKCVEFNKIHFYFEEIFKQTVITTDINLIYAILLKYNEFVYPKENEFFYIDKTKRLDKLNILFIEHNLEIDYVKYYINNFKINRLDSIYNKSSHYYCVYDRLSSHIKKLMLLKRNVQINKILNHA